MLTACFVYFQRTVGHDWCIIRLGNWPVGGQILGFSLDTAFFTGNFPPRASIQGARLSRDQEFPRSELMMGQESSDHMEKVKN